MSVGVCVCSEGGALMRLGVGGYCLCASASVFVHLFFCLNASHVPACMFAYSSCNNEIICFTLQTYGRLIRTEQRAVVQVEKQVKLFSHRYALNWRVGVVLTAA